MKKIFFFSILIFAGLSVRAQETLPLSAIKDIILQNHPSLKMVEASYRAAEVKAEGAYSWMAPEFGAGFFQTPYNAGKWKSTADMPGMGMFMISAEQMFPNKKAQEAEHAFLKSTGAIEIEKKPGMLSNLLTTARTAYYNLIVAEKRTGLYNENEKLLEFMIQSAEIRYRNNLGNINSYYKLKAALAKLKTAEAVLSAHQAQQQTVINNTMMREETTAFNVDTIFSWYPFETLLTDEDALTKTSEYRVLEKTIAANNLEQQAELAALKPQYGIKYEHMAGFGRQPQMFSLMAMVKLPLAKWSAKMNRAKAESITYENQGLQSQQRAYINAERGKSRSLFAELQGIKNELKMYDDEIIPALHKNLQTLQISYEQNKAEISELYDAWQSLLDARMDYLDTLARGMTIQSELLNIFQMVDL
ncbi:MAG: TolC family protein [Chitinophagaceae bacterium]|nr:TolC family protein [Chitinophagaceae bacterium]